MENRKKKKRKKYYVCKRCDAKSRAKCVGDVVDGGRGRGEVSVVPVDGELSAPTRLEETFGWGRDGGGGGGGVSGVN